MVVRIPSDGEWTKITDSSLVWAVAYDEAAERIFVRVIPKGLIVFEECSPETWSRFGVSGTSRGAYVTNVLMLHPHIRL